MFKQIQSKLNTKQVRRATFLLTMGLVLTCVILTQVRADAIYLIEDSQKTTVLDGTSTVSDSRIIVTGAYSKNPQVSLPSGEKVTLTHGDTVEYATTRGSETVSALLERMGISVTELEMVMVDVSGDEVKINIASDFTYYETLTEKAEHTTLYSLKYDLPKGETEVVQQGIDGTREVTYEVIYADGQMVSRQAVEEKNNTSVPEIAYLGTLVDAVAQDDTILSVVHSGDGSGYLKMTSGDSLHFSGTMEVTCTAYTDGYGKVDEVTATGTVVRVGCVAVDKRVIPLGTKMFVSCKNYSYGMAIAEDTGVRGSKVDVYLPTYEECISFGKRSGTVYFID